MRPFRAVGAVLAVALASALPGRAALAQGAADCPPEPTLACVAMRATEAVQRMHRDSAAKPFITLALLATLAFAQHKAGLANPLADTVGLVAALRPDDTPDRAVFLVRYGSADDGRAMLQRLVKEAEDDAAARSRQRNAPIYFSSVVAALAEAGLVAEARAHLARVRAAADPAAASMPPQERIAYETRVAVAASAAGDRSAASAAADRAWAAVKAAEGEPARKLQARVGLLWTLLAAGLVDQARPILAEVRREYGDGPVALVAFRIAVASGDAAARRAELAVLQKLRPERAADNSGWRSGDLRAEFDAMLHAGERAAAAAIYADAKSASGRGATRATLRWDGHVGLGRMAAALGDEAGVAEALAGLATTKRRSETDADFRKGMVGYIVEICAGFAEFARAAAFYRCVARITPEEARPHLVELARHHVTLAEALARR